MTERLAAALAASLLFGTPVLSAFFFGEAAAAASVDCTTAKTQLDLDTCAGDAFAQADASLNGTYRTIIARLDGADPSRKSLVAAQNAWITFRNAECDFEASGSIGGSIHPMVVTECRTKLTGARTLALRRLLDCGEGDLSCPLPPKPIRRE